eukprot:69173-Pleurochrysis_carterae.AAC.1
MQQQRTLTKLRYSRKHSCNCSAGQPALYTQRQRRNQDGTERKPHTVGQNHLIACALRLRCGLRFSESHARLPLVGLVESAEGLSTGALGLLAVADANAVPSGRKPSLIVPSSGGGGGGGGGVGHAGSSTRDVAGSGLARGEPMPGDTFVSGCWIPAPRAATSEVRMAEGDSGIVGWPRGTVSDTNSGMAAGTACSFCPKAFESLRVLKER